MLSVGSTGCGFAVCAIHISVHLQIVHLSYTYGLGCTVSSRCVLKSYPIHMKYLTGWRDSLEMIENVWLHCNLGSLNERLFLQLFWPLGDTFGSKLSLASRQHSCFIGNLWGMAGQDGVS